MKEIKKTTKTIALLLCLIMIVSIANPKITSNAASFGYNELHTGIVFLDLPTYSKYGKADATLVTYYFQGEYHYYLVDCGDATSYSYLKRRLNTLCKSRKDGNKVVLDGLIITHHHDDHMGAVNRLLNDFYVKDIYYSSVGHLFSTFQSAKNNHPKTKDGQYYNYHLLKSGVGSTVNIRIASKNNYVASPLAMKLYGPRTEKGLSKNNPTTDEENNESIVVTVYGREQTWQFNAILMGDVKNAGLNTFLNYYGSEVQPIIWSVCKYGHHGVRKSDTPKEIKSYQNYIRSWHYVFTVDLNKLEENQGSTDRAKVETQLNEIKSQLSENMFGIIHYYPGMYDLTGDGDIIQGERFYY